MPLSMPSLSSQCALVGCGRPAYTEVLLLGGGELRVALSLCKADAAAVTLGDWRLSLNLIIPFQTVCINGIQLLPGKLGYGSPTTPTASEGCALPP
jgi:hypothetical protein